jgi:hypothetical protein
MKFLYLLVQKYITILLYPHNLVAFMCFLGSLLYLFKSIKNGSWHTINQLDDSGYVT